jgi:hypothetical protein
MTRINNIYTRLYVDGYDVSGYANEISELGWDFKSTPQTAFSDECYNTAAGKVTISAGVINSFLDNDAAGLTALTKAGVGTRNILVTMGTNAVAVMGDPCFAWMFEESQYKTASGDGFLAATLNVGNASYASLLTNSKPWGIVLHAKGVETAANTAIGVDDNGAASALGGIFVYHLVSSNGTCTLSVDDAATNTNPSFAALSGATSGSINASVTPQHGMVALGATATVRRYLRPQIAFGTATTATYISAFIRN